MERTAPWQRKDETVLRHHASFLRSSTDAFQNGLYLSIGKAFSIENASLNLAYSSSLNPSARKADTVARRASAIP